MAREEAQQLAELLTYRQRSISGTLGGGFPLMRASLWHSDTAVASAAQSLTPQMTENQAKVASLPGSRVGNAFSCSSQGGFPGSELASDETSLSSAAVASAAQSPAPLMAGNPA